MCSFRGEDVAKKGMNEGRRKFERWVSGCHEEKYKSDIIKERKCCASAWNVKHLLKIEPVNVQCLFVCGKGVKEAV